MVWVDALLVMFAVAVALSMRPWRALSREGPPWPWLAWCAALPLLWSVDRVTGLPLVQPLSGACALMLMAGWPLAVLGLLPVAALAALAGGLPPEAALSRLVWLGLAPATLGLVFGAAVRRWLPHHLFVYILGRGFFATAAAGMLAGVAATWLLPLPTGLAAHDVALAHGLTAWGDAFLCGMVAAVFVAFRPQWLATYTDRLYLPK